MGIVAGTAACSDAAWGPAGPESQAGRAVTSALPDTAGVQADVTELPKWETVIRGMAEPGCVFHFRRATGAYASREYKLVYSDAAKEVAKDWWQPLVYNVPGVVTRPTGDGGTETLPEHLGIRAVCVMPKSDQGTDEAVGAVEAILDSLGVSALGTDSAHAAAPAPEEEEEAPSWVLAALGWVRNHLSPRPLSAAQDPSGGSCPLLPPADCVVDEIGVKVTATPIRISCPAGFDFDWGAVGCTHTGFTPTPLPVPAVPAVPIGSGGSKRPPPPPRAPNCTDDQTAIADEYERHGYSARWTCELFDDAVTTEDFHGTDNDGAEEHLTGYLEPTYILGRNNVFARVHVAGISNTGINSDWRCPDGNAAVGGEADSQHVLGTAGDFTARNFSEAIWREFERAALAEGPGWYSGYGTRRSCPAPYGRCYLGHIHIDWGPRRGHMLTGGN
ncbi:D-Ala-D-Ala carboxypeptidase family metallohydrolase [Candidatus Palauibacter sp.]|uniref:D-Ala-D-Ala carboxypeptidase family metallohydrolase n=1 Tax=Candidatus Palauibacter sp. TaxID=3101350 RepID=UPI003B018B4B